MYDTALGHPAVRTIIAAARQAHAAQDCPTCAPVLSPRRTGLGWHLTQVDLDALAAAYLRAANPDARVGVYRDGRLTDL